MDEQEPAWKEAVCYIQRMGYQHGDQRADALLGGHTSISLWTED